MSTTEPTAHPAAPDAIGFLSAQHRQVEALWSRIEGSPTATPDRDDSARQIVTLLSQHDAIETQLLYPELRKVGGDEGTHLSDHSLEEHQHVRELLKEVDRADDLDERAYSTLTECLTAVNDHVAEEEGQIFPLLRAHCDADRLQELGSKMAAMMDTAPTHPHPSTPDSKLGATIAGAVTGTVDRARDAMRDDQ